MGKVQAKARLGSTSNKKRDAPPHAPKHDPLDHHLRNQRGGGCSQTQPTKNHTLPPPGELLPISWDPTRSQEKLDIFKIQ